MKIRGLLLIALLVISAVGLTAIYVVYEAGTSNTKQEFYFGISYGKNTTIDLTISGGNIQNYMKTITDAKILIDKVKDYTTFFLINSWDLNINETSLNEVCDYAANANLHFMVFFDFISNQTYLWHQTWLDTAKQRWGDKFLGVYLYDEPGGKQIETGQWDGGTIVRDSFANVSSPREAAQTFLKLGQTQSMNALRSRGIPVFTSDFALYWYDYQAGYNSVFVELGWNVSRAQQIALCRGAANAFGKDWGAIITWTYQQPPYIANGSTILQDMQTAYDAGAKYVIVFDFPTYPEDNPYGILTEEHFFAMQQFWNYAQSAKDKPKVKPEAVLMLPENYGGGLRRPDDNVWAPLVAPPPTNASDPETYFNVTWRTTWPPDTQTPIIWENLNKLSDKYGLKLDVVFDGEKLNIIEQYPKVYFWNETIP